MRTPTRTYQLAALFLAVSGGLHIAGAIMSGFDTPAPQMMSVGVFFLLVAFLLRGGRRWLAYIAFLMTAFGAAIAYAYWGGDTNYPDWAYLGISIADALCAIVLFFIIWRTKPVAIA